MVNFDYLKHLTLYDQTLLTSEMRILIEDMKAFFEHDLQAIGLYGSISDGSYLKDKGDLDFIIFVNRELNEEDLDYITDLHRLYKRQTSFLKYLEGCYVSMNKQGDMSGGIYIGSTESGWKLFTDTVLTVIDHAHISNGIKWICGSAPIDRLFQFDWFILEDALVAMAEKNIQTIGRFNDWDFKLHLLHVGARALSLLNTHVFRSKPEALQWLKEQPEFIASETLISQLLPFRSMLSLNEKAQLDQLGAQNVDLLLLAIMNQIIAHHLPQAEDVC